MPLFRKVAQFLVLIPLFSIVQLAHAVDSNTLNVAYFSKDVPAIEPLSPSFDPDSYAVITQIFDTLVYLDLDGKFQPQLATTWQQLTPTSWEFLLRKNVSFHNGEPFDGYSVKFTYEHAINPVNKSGNAWILSSIDKVEVDQKDPFRIVIHTKFPDGMFLNRLNMFGSICPPDYIKEHGIEHFFLSPVGTGPYKFSRWKKGEYIELKKNQDYWLNEIPHIETLKFHILPEDQWLKGFVEGKLDFIPNLAGNQTSNLMQQAKGEANIVKRLVLSGYWVLLKNQGPLADRRVRKALNLAVNKAHLVQFGDFGNAAPLASLGKKGEFGQNSNIEPYPYDPQKAKSLLKQAGLEGNLRLRAIAADIAEPIAKIIRQNLEQIGIELDLEVVARSEWANKVIVHKILNGKPADYDLAINLVDNPIHNLAFHAGLFLFSGSPWSLINSPEFDEKYMYALQTSQSDQHEARLQALDKYIHDEALMLFTTQRIITAAVRSNVSIPKFSLNGHLDYEVLTTAKFKSNKRGDVDE